MDSWIDVLSAVAAILFVGGVASALGVFLVMHSRSRQHKQLSRKRRKIDLIQH